MNTIYYAINFLGFLAGFLCVAMICMSVFKIMTGDEQDHRQYMNRIRNGMIALVLIISISVVKNLVLKYFPYQESAESIGDFSNITVSISDGTLTEEHKDCQGRNVIRVDGFYYVNTGEKLINIGGFWDSYKVWCSVYKAFDDCQGITKGAMASDVYYLSWEGTKLKGASKGFLMSADVKGHVKDDNDFKELMGDWLNKKYEQYQWVFN